ncbi:MAG: hypothetical protein O7J95_01995 [Planctomycetota bacterium]|nr:hypothetical protein [Planctomycetota bacterium]
MDKGSVSNLISGIVLAIALFLLPRSEVQALILSAGMFAFSGGVTNSLAVKMLFDRLPGLVGSGVIPARFREIRQAIKRLIMEHFFSESYLREFLAGNARDVDWMRYVKGNPGKGGLLRAVLEQHWERLTSPESMKPALAAAIDRLLDSSFGGFLHMLGRQTIEETVESFIGSFLDEMKARVFEAGEAFRQSGSLELELDPDAVIEDLRKQVVVLLDQKLEQLDAEHVKKMIEDVIRSHLGWLVVWGNVFGGLLGVAAYFLQGQGAGSG